MAYHIVEKQPLHIVGIRIPLVCDMEENLRVVPDFWKAALQGNQFSEIYKLSNQEPDGILGISVYESPKEIYYYIGVAANASAPAGMYEYEIPAATWVIFENNGRLFLSALLWEAFWELHIWPADLLNFQLCKRRRKAGKAFLFSWDSFWSFCLFLVWERYLAR